MTTDVENLPDVTVEGEGLFEQGVVAAPSDDTLQWRAEVLQLVNWGGFSGRVTVDLHGDATMISGPPGSARAPCSTPTRR